MKKSLFLMFMLRFFFISCTKENTTIAPPGNKEVKYEVITASGEWFGEWVDKDNKRQTMATSPWNKSGWSLTFTPNTFPMELTCHASSTCICKGTASSPDITVNIYVDGKLVKTETNNWAKGVTTAVYKLD